ncbi:MAG: hypothetical protein PVF15_07140 [Candidatus Bathyarchaeota archaeon]
MYNRKRLAILAVTSVIGGFLLTLISGLYIVNLPLTDSEAIYFGFPFSWLKAGRKTLFSPPPPPPWIYHFLRNRFIVDFAIYTMLVASALTVYFKFLSKRKKKTTQLPAQK